MLPVLLQESRRAPALPFLASLSSPSQGSRDIPADAGLAGSTTSALAASSSQASPPIAASRDDDEAAEAPSLASSSLQASGASRAIAASRLGGEEGSSLATASLPASRAMAPLVEEAGIGRALESSLASEGVGLGLSSRSADRRSEEESRRSQGDVSLGDTDSASAFLGFSSLEELDETQESGELPLVPRRPSAAFYAEFRNQFVLGLVLDLGSVLEYCFVDGCLPFILDADLAHLEHRVRVLVASCSEPGETDVTTARMALHGTAARRELRAALASVLEACEDDLCSV